MKGRKIMKKHTAILLSCAVAIAMLFSLVQVAPVKAVPPVPYYLDLGEGPVEYIDCGSFQISHIWKVDETGIIHFDQEGHQVRSNVTDRFWVHYWRDGTDLELFNETHWSGGYTYDDDGNVVTAFGHGKIMLIHVPGYGAIFRETGYMFMNYVTGEWVQHGQHHDLTTPEYTAMCNYFTGE
jgi:hypothetical protein